MGTEAFWVPLALTALGTGANMYNENRVAQRQEDESTKLMTTQQRQQQKADAALNDNLTSLEGSTPEAERQKALGGFLEMLRANSSSAEGGGSIAGASDRYGQDAATSQAAIQNYGVNRADNLSRIVAPGRQRMNEDIATGRTGDVVAGVARDADAERFLSMLRMNSIRSNPYLEAGGQIANGAAAGASAYYANRPDPTGGLEEIKIGAKRIPGNPKSAWAGRIPQPAQRVA